MYLVYILLFGWACSGATSADPIETLPCAQFANLLDLDDPAMLAAIPIQPAFDLVELGDDWLDAHASDGCPATWADGHSDQSSSGWEGSCETSDGVVVDGRLSRYSDAVERSIELDGVQLRESGVLVFAGDGGWWDEYGSSSTESSWDLSLSIGLGSDWDGDYVLTGVAIVDDRVWTGRSEMAVNGKGVCRQDEDVRTRYDSDSLRYLPESGITRLRGTTLVEINWSAGGCGDATLDGAAVGFLCF